MRFDPLRVSITLCFCVASTAAPAWQLPKTEPVAKVEVCAEMGEGYVRVPGSGTCLKLSGSVRVEGAHIGGAAAFQPESK